MRAQPAELTVAVVGLGFGAAFVPLYLSHPDVADVVLVDTDPQRRESLARTFALSPGRSDLSEVLADPAIDAVHLLTPVATHAQMAITAMQAGKHVACAVPMATSLDDLDRVVAAQQSTGRHYMMMETSVRSRELATVRQLRAHGVLGDLTLYRGCHVQNLDGFPSYWQGFPPMHYLTHALSPILELEDTTVAEVTAHGAGRLTAERRSGGFDNPFPAEIGLFTLRGSEVLVDITMALFQTARQYVEGFSLYGALGGVEWPAQADGPLRLHEMTDPPPGQRGNPVTISELEPTHPSGTLPAELEPFTHDARFHRPGMVEPVTVPAHHGGSHPFLVDEFVRSIVEERPPSIDAHRAATWTAPGICAHASALAGGRPMTVPEQFGAR